MKRNSIELNKAISTDADSRAVQFLKEYKEDSNEEGDVEDD